VVDHRASRSREKRAPSSCSDARRRGRGSDDINLARAAVEKRATGHVHLGTDERGPLGEEPETGPAAWQPPRRLWLPSPLCWVHAHGTGSTDTSRSVRVRSTRPVSGDRCLTESGSMGGGHGIARHPRAGCLRQRSRDTESGSARCGASRGSGARGRRGDCAPWGARHPSPDAWNIPAWRDAAVCRDGPCRPDGFEGITPGAYLIAASKTGFPRTAVVPVHVSAGRTIDGVDVVLERGAVITGRISDEHGCSTAGAHEVAQHRAVLIHCVQRLDSDAGERISPRQPSESSGACWCGEKEPSDQRNACGEKWADRAEPIVLPKRLGDSEAHGPDQPAKHWPRQHFLKRGHLSLRDRIAVAKSFGHRREQRVPCRQRATECVDKGSLARSAFIGPVNVGCLSTSVPLKDTEASIGRHLEEFERLTRANVAYGSGRNRRVKQPTTVGPPAVSTNTRSYAVLANGRFRCQPASPACVRWLL